MAAFVALWPKPDEDVDGFEAHYRESHLPIVEAYPGATSVKTVRLTGTPRGEEAPYHLLTVVRFESSDDLQAALRSEPGARSAEDARTIVQRFGSKPVLLIAEDF